jgi:hypothetical protein
MNEPQLTNEDDAVVTHGGPAPEIDITKLDKATINQLRKNIERLKSRTQIQQLKTVSHFNIGAFFPLKSK